MTLPSVTITKNVFTTGQAPADVTGILAIVASSSTGSVNLPGGFSRTDLALDEFGHGPLVEFAGYDIAVANKPVVLMRGNATFVGAYGALDTSGVSGTSVVTTTGGSEPFDDYHVVVEIVVGGTVGVAGITYTFSLDGGETVSGTKSLGVATTLAIPNTGVSFDLGAGTLVAGDTWSVFTTRPQLNNTDALDSLNVLQTTRLPFEGILLDCSVSSSTVGLIDTELSSWEQQGMFKFCLLNTRYKNEPSPSAESESAYAASLTTLVEDQTSIRICVGADGGHVASLVTGQSLKRPTSLFLAARAMLTPIGEDAAFVARGPLPSVRIADTNGNPLDHDEDLYPNLDGLRLVSLRSFSPGGPEGTYITNPNSIQPSGGAFPYLQHIRIMNRACGIAWAVLTTQLSRGVRKNSRPDPVTGAVTIFEPDAAAIEGMVNDALTQPMKGQVSEIQFSLSRTDDLNAVPAIVNGLLAIVALAYIKGFVVQAQFQKTISTAL